MTSPYMHRKPLLDISEQIQNLRDRGVRFERCDEPEAKRHLAEISNLLHVSAYRVLFQRHADGPDAGKFIDPDFADLVAPESLDYQLRDAFMGATLAAETKARTKLLNRMTREEENGYTIVSDFLSSLNPSFKKVLTREIEQRKAESDLYTGALIDRYHNDMPVWVFTEVVTFGTLLSLYRFCAIRWDDRLMLDEHYLLKQVKAVRNACAHGSCIINGFQPGLDSAIRTSRLVYAALNTSGINNSKSRRAKLANPRIQQLVATLHVLCFLVGSAAPHKVPDAMHSLSANLSLTAAKYGVQNPFVSYLAFLANIIGLWVP